MDIERIKTDIKKEEEGVWIDFAEGIRLKIARARNIKYMEYLRDLVEPVRGDIRHDKLEAESFAEILLKVRAKTILLDWKNIEEAGKPVLYSVEKAEEYFRNPELKDFYKFVVAVSENADQYKKDLIEDAEKN